MQPRLGRAQRDAERGGDLRQGHPKEVMEHDDRAPAGLERPQAAIEEVAIDDARREVARRRDRGSGSARLRRAPPTAPHEVETGVDEQSMEPGVEPVGVAQRGQVPPAADHRVLDGISRELAVTEDQAGGRVQPRDGCAGERRRRRHDRHAVLARRVLAGPRSPQDVGTTEVAVLDILWRRRHPNRSGRARITAPDAATPPNPGSWQTRRVVARGRPPDRGAKAATFPIRSRGSPFHPEPSRAGSRSRTSAQSA